MNSRRQPVRSQGPYGSQPQAAGSKQRVGQLCPAASEAPALQQPRGSRRRQVSQILRASSGRQHGRNQLAMGIAFMCVFTAKRAPLCAGGEKCSEPSSCRANSSGDAAGAHWEAVGSPARHRGRSKLLGFWAAELSVSLRGPDPHMQQRCQEVVLRNCFPPLLPSPHGQAGACP